MNDYIRPASYYDLTPEPSEDYCGECEAELELRFEWPRVNYGPRRVMKCPVCEPEEEEDE